jgi:hypothetical protein
MYEIHGKSIVILRFSIFMNRTTENDKPTLKKTLTQHAKNKLVTVATKTLALIGLDKVSRANSPSSSAD